MTSLPDSLPFIPLHDKVILPNIISEIVLCKGEREYLKHASRTPYFVCIPLKQQQEKNIMPASDISLLFHYGCTIKILDIDSSLPGTSVVRVQGLCASEILDFTSTNGVDFEVTVQHYQDEEDISGRAHDQFQSTCKEFIEKMELIGVSSALLFQFSQSIKSLPISKVANLLISIADVSFFDRLAALEETDFKMRILQINHAIKHHLQVISPFPNEYLEFLCIFCIITFFFFRVFVV
jgi:ATP-dependent Lon protease